MTKSPETGNGLDPIGLENGLEGLTNGASPEAGPGLDNRHMASMLAFLGREIDRSAEMLRDLAACLSHELCELGGMESAASVQQRLVVSTMALQNEDRIQQRLRDLRAALSVLERTLTVDHPVPRPEIDRAIVDHLRLDEMRRAFAISVDMDDASLRSSEEANSPAIGDIDLF